MKKKINKKTQAAAKDNKYVFIVLISIITLAVYGNSLSNDFVYDDESLIMGDPSITSLSNIPGYFTGSEGFQKVMGRYYRPAVSSSYSIDYSIWGLKPFGFHLTNVLIHVINSVLFFQFLLLVFRRYRNEKNYQQISFFSFAGALIFAVHPVHTEAVSWISGRTDSLSFTFFISAFVCYLKYSENDNSKKKIYLILTFIFYAISLVAKEVPVIFPAAVFY